MLGRLIKYRASNTLLKLPSGGVLEVKWKPGFSLGEVVLLGVNSLSGEVKDYYKIIGDVEPPETEVSEEDDY